VTISVREIAGEGLYYCVTNYHQPPVQRQRREIDELRAQVRALIGGRAAIRE
jgi:hypothetical protein